ncbi:Transposase (plasmid) [Roseomonas mucosa]|uniref:DDE-type integrase/transposase/recombinase n=1 Tax=Roseomonas TaxID=125216 RepID=UPI0009E0ADB4|nr:Transposase [Roseomonas mucosa]QDD97936.1 Transposase [Roseomonas mucosa]QET91654.1 DDE-type integrase/transposase/recombinase [Roseomonas mucosa]UZO94124.1 Transposase [Roseomonas mucosa]
MPPPSVPRERGDRPAAICGCRVTPRLLTERRNSAYKNNSLEQDHRGLKGRIRCMRGFKSFASAERFCRGYNELRNHLRLRSRHNQHVSADRRRAAAALVILQSA